ncbi:MAG: T9SS type A sorting domain-containing protein [Melioribacteraceae bacterium]|nr:T9SS type A sorting domain-containing protein [Melioribacteraceae bacterium]
MNKFKILPVLVLGIILFYFIQNEIITQQKDKSIKKPNEWSWIKRTYPHYKANINSQIDAIKKAKLMRTEKSLSKKNSDAEWEFAGPLNIGGRITDIEYNPKDPSIIYAGSATGGVLKSADGGITWESIFDEQSSLSIGDIGIDPNFPDTIYVGTGEPNGGHNNFPGIGIYKSIDAGETWDHIGLEKSASIGRIIVDPSDSKIVYAAAVGSYFLPNSERGVYKSTDGGVTWEKSLYISDSTGAVDIVINPQNPSILLVSMWERVRRPDTGTHLSGRSGGIYKTTNGGFSWEEVTEGLPNPRTEDVGRIGLTLCQSSPNVIYSLYNDGSYVTGVYKSVDYGDTWTKMKDPGLQGGFSWYFGQIRVHPKNSKLIYALDVEMKKFNTSLDAWIPMLDNTYELHVDHHALAFHPTDSLTIINGNDGGINISHDLGTTWQATPSLPVTQFYEIGLDKTNPQRLYGGTQDNNTIRTATGALDDWEYLLGGDGFYVNVDPNDPDIIYAESQFGGLVKIKVYNGIKYYLNAMEGINTNDPTNWSTPVIMDPNNSSTLYYGTNKVYKTSNSAGSWEAISPVLSTTENVSNNSLTTIDVAPSNSNIVYAGTGNGRVWIYNGEDWKEISEGLPNRWVTRVKADPRDASVVYVTFSGLKWVDPQPHVFMSENFGETWEDISSNLPDSPVNAFEIDRNDSTVLYLGSDVGAYVSFNKGTNWEPIAENLPIVSVYDMKIHSTENYLAIGTHGRGIYKIDLNKIVSVENSQTTLMKDYRLSQNYPNPFNPSTTINYRIGKTGLVSLIIYNSLGQEIKTLVKENQSNGNYRVAWYGDDNRGKPVSSGVYYYRLESKDFIQVKKMSLVK